MHLRRVSEGIRKTNRYKICCYCVYVLYEQEIYIDIDVLSKQLMMKQLSLELYVIMVICVKEKCRVFVCRGTGC